ncbi:MAG: hypothetical protein Q8K68_06895 [Nitrospirota bacterium]|nr:hypothetical protein [Nitrospirota bacterium]
MDKPLVSRFFLLLQQGVVIRRRINCSIATFLREELAADTETIEQIQSIILDGKPVDDLEAALIKDGSTLALSAAMPGLVGATLRRGGTYSSFRNAITYHETGEMAAPGEGCVRIKLFNLLMAGLGPGLLQRGVFLESADFLNFTAGLSQDFREGCRLITLDSRPLDVRQLLDAAWLSGKDRVFLVVAEA